MKNLNMQLVVVHSITRIANIAIASVFVTLHQTTRCRILESLFSFSSSE
jgi:hypothetical protein